MSFLTPSISKQPRQPASPHRFADHVGRRRHLANCSKGLINSSDWARELQSKKDWGIYSNAMQGAWKQQQSVNPCLVEFERTVPAEVKL
jgi:hypothetical protein